MRVDSVNGGRITAGVAVAGATLALSACGSSAKPHASSPYGPASSPFALSKCMRANGVSNFPDPTAGPGGEGFNGVGVSNTGTLIDGTTFAGPAATAAEKACKEYLPPGGPPPQMSAAQKARLLTFARCMRSNGVSNFPDPSFGTAAPAKIAGSPNGIDPQAPAFRHALARCGGHGNQRVAVSAP
jgi:hypothetical protein